MRMKTVPQQQEHLYAIERIIDSRETSTGQWEHLIKWKDCAASENSWETVNDLYSKRKSPPFANDADDASQMVIVDIDSIRIGIALMR